MNYSESNMRGNFLFLVHLTTVLSDTPMLNFHALYNSGEHINKEHSENGALCLGAHTPWPVHMQSKWSNGVWTNKLYRVVFQSSSVAQLCLTLCNHMDCSTPGLPVHHQLPEYTQTHVHWVSDAIQSSHPLSFFSPPALHISQHQGLFKWVSSLYQVAKVLEFQL